MALQEFCDERGGSYVIEDNEFTGGVTYRVFIDGWTFVYGIPSDELVKKDRDTIEWCIIANLTDLLDTHFK